MYPFSCVLWAIFWSFSLLASKTHPKSSHDKFKTASKMIFFLYDAQIMLREKSSFKFSNKVIFYQVLLRLFPVCFPDFIRQIARYPFS